MPSPFITTNFTFSDGMDVGQKLITKDYLLSVYPQLVPNLKTPELWIWGPYKTGTSSFSFLNTAAYISQTADWKQVSYCKYGASNSTFHAAAIRSDGSLYTWGDNNDGQLGLSVTGGNVRTTPTRVGTANDWKQVSCGAFYTLAIKNDGTMYAWGNNQFKQADGTVASTAINSPKQIGTNISWKFVAAGYRCSFAISTENELYTWGTNLFGCLGIGDSSSSTTKTTPFKIGSNWKYVDANYGHVVSIKMDGSMYNWGYNEYGQLGLGYNSGAGGFVSSPTQAGNNDTDWKQCSAGVYHTAAIKTNGKLYSCGSNDSGALGINNSTNSYTSNTFVEVYNKSLWKQLSCGYSFTSAIRMDGGVWSWGNNRDNELGSINYSRNNYNYVTIPVENTLYSKNWKQVACGPFAVAAIKSFDFI